MCVTVAPRCYTRRQWAIVVGPMEFHPLVLDPVPVQQRNRFHDEPALQREGVFEHWQRCVALGVPVDGPNPEDVLERGASLRERTARLERLLLDGRGVLDRVSATAARNHYGFVVADPDGVVVHIGGGGDFEAVASDRFPGRRNGNARGCRVAQKSRQISRLRPRLRSGSEVRLTPRTQVPPLRVVYISAGVTAQPISCPELE